MLLFATPCCLSPYQALRSKDQRTIIWPVNSGVELLLMGLQTCEISKSSPSASRSSPGREGAAFRQLFSTCTSPVLISPGITKCDRPGSITSVHEPQPRFSVTHSVSWSLMESCFDSRRLRLRASWQSLSPTPGGGEERSGQKDAQKDARDKSLMQINAKFQISKTMMFDTP